MINILKTMRKELVDELLCINLERGEECRSILYSKNNNGLKKIFKKLWPDLELIVFLKDGNYRLHTARAEEYIGDVKFFCPIFFTPEVTMGYCINLDCPTKYILDSRNGYFEFINVSQNDVVGIRDLKIGELYNVIVSTANTGLIRYATGEIIRVIGYYNGSPEIEPVCRENDLVKMHVNNVMLIITPDEICSILIKKLRIIDFCWRKDLDTRTKKLRIYIELMESEYVSDSTTFDNKTKSDVKTDVNKNVKDSNIINVILNKLRINVDIKIVKPGTFDNMYKSRYSEYIDPALIQIPRAISSNIDCNILKNGILCVLE